MRMLKCQTAEKTPVAADTWSQIVEASRSPTGGIYLAQHVFRKLIHPHASLRSAIPSLLTHKLSSESDLPSDMLLEATSHYAREEAALERMAEADIRAYVERDPACPGPLQAFLFYKGFHAIQAYRFSHWLWRRKETDAARVVHCRAATVFAIDIHPAARIGSGLFIDHGTGIVIGETAEVGDNVSIYHNVTLGGTGKESGKRHPYVEDGVTLYAGSTVLGPIRIGAGSVVAASSLVLNRVDRETTVMGVPARRSIPINPLLRTPRLEPKPS